MYAFCPLPTFACLSPSCGGLADPNDAVTERKTIDVSWGTPLRCAANNITEDSEIWCVFGLPRSAPPRSNSNDTLSVSTTDAGTAVLGTAGLDRKSVRCEVPTLPADVQLLLFGDPVQAKAKPPKPLTVTVTIESPRGNPLHFHRLFANEDTPAYTAGTAARLDQKDGRMSVLSYTYMYNATGCEGCSGTNSPFASSGSGLSSGSAFGAQCGLCGVCNGGKAFQDCRGVCFGAWTVDKCGVCRNPNAKVYTPNVDMDCSGQCHGTAQLDECSVCYGGTGAVATIRANSTRDCRGICQGGAKVDHCKVCGGLNKDKDCKGVCFGTSVCAPPAKPVKPPIKPPIKPPVKPPVTPPVTPVPPSPPVTDGTHHATTGGTNHASGGVGTRGTDDPRGTDPDQARQEGGFQLFAGLIGMIVFLCAGCVWLTRYRALRWAAREDMREAVEEAAALEMGQIGSGGLPQVDLDALKLETYSTAEEAPTMYGKDTDGQCLGNNPSARSLNNNINSAMLAMSAGRSAAQETELGSPFGEEVRTGAQTRRKSIARKETSETCAICIADFEDGDITRVLPCKHRFCAISIEQWFRRSTFCPLCKRDLKGTAALLAPPPPPPPPSARRAGRLPMWGRRGRGRNAATSPEEKEEKG